jgi:hypothetical protein
MNGSELSLDDTIGDLPSDQLVEIASQRELAISSRERAPQMSVPAIPPPQLDLVLVIDATGSMRAALKAAHDYAIEIASAFRINRRLQLQIGSVCYRDPVDTPEDEHEVCPFTFSLLHLREFLSGVAARGGGDDPEDYVGAIEAIVSLSWRPAAQRGVVWIADAPAHGARYCGQVNHQEEEGKLEPLVRQMAAMNIKFQGFSINSRANRTFTEMAKIYTASQPGLFFKFEDFQAEKGTVEVQAKTMGDIVSETLKVRVHEFLRPVGARPVVAHPSQPADPARAAASPRGPTGRPQCGTVTFLPPSIGPL